MHFVTPVRSSAIMQVWAWRTPPTSSSALEVNRRFFAMLRLFRTEHTGHCFPGRKLTGEHEYFRARKYCKITTSLIKKLRGHLSNSYYVRVHEHQLSLNFVAEFGIAERSVAEFMRSQQWKTTDWPYFNLSAELPASTGEKPTIRNQKTAPERGATPFYRIFSYCNKWS